MHYCSFFHDDSLLPADIREAVESVMFERLVGVDESEEMPARSSGGPEDRTPEDPARETRAREVRARGGGVRDDGVQIGAAREPRALQHSSGAMEASGHESAPLHAAVNDILRNARFLGFTRSNSDLSEKVSHDAVHWVTNQWSQLSADDPFAEEEAGLNALRQWEVSEARTDDAAGSVDAAIACYREAYPDASIAARFYHEKLLSTRNTFESGRNPATSHASRRDDRIAEMERRVALRDLARDWEARLQQRRRSHRTSFLRRALLPYIANLNEQVPRMHGYLQLMKNFFGTTSGLWDMSPGVWQKTNFELLEQFAQVLENETTIQELADLLGKGRGADEGEQEVEERLVRTWVPYTAGAGKSEITGVRFSDDLTSVLAGEVALLSREETEVLFYKKLLEKELLSLQYTAEAIYRRSETRVETVRKVKRTDRGPLILCIDTSGSMAGRPERVAKALCLAILRSVFRTGRQAYLIAFSDRIRVLDVADPRSALPDVCEFLSYSFHGGTDLRPALDEALRVVRTTRFRLADILIVSDFRVPKILDHHVDAITASQRDLDTGFYSLTVHTRAVTDMLNTFDRSWLYDLSRSEGPGIPASALTPL